MELWQIGVICILMLPLFFLANYLMVRSAVRKMKERDELLEIAVSKSIERMAEASRNPRKRRKRW